MRKSRIFIYNLYDYCGGTLVLSKLCSTLRAIGYDARLFLSEKAPADEKGCRIEQKTYRMINIQAFLKVLYCKLFLDPELFSKFNYWFYFPRHLRGPKRQWLPFYNKKHDIVLYPDVVYGNPLGANNVVRWLLFNYSYFEDILAFNSTDLFVGYREIFNDRSKTPNIENVEIATFDKSLYKRVNYGIRKGNCYIVRKGWNRKDLPTEFDGPVIDEMPEEEKVAIFNECEYCYSYDTQTFYSSIAAICGCISIVVPESGKSYSDYRTQDEKSYGVAMGNSKEEIERAVNSVDKLIDAVNSFDEKNIHEAEHFVSILEKYFHVEIARCKRISK